MLYRDETAPFLTGTMISEFANPSMPRVFEALGFDFAIVDCEHGAFDVQTVSAMANVATGTALDLWVRVPRISRDYVGRYLDAGAVGIIAPMVETAEQAAELVQMARYTPIGSRGISVTRAHSGYLVPDLPGYLAAANERVKLYVQIETQKAVDAVADICAVPGLTGVIVGPNDLLGDLGLPGQLKSPVLRDVIQNVFATAKAHGIAAGTITGDRDLLEHAIECGADVVSINSDIGYLLRGARAQLTAMGLSP
jgi:4-hydroxy-2-oxoheptanedioate aldolase